MKWLKKILIETRVKFCRERSATHEYLESCGRYDGFNHGVKLVIEEITRDLGTLADSDCYNGNESAEFVRKKVNKYMLTLQRFGRKF